jgi:hypothetical protein
MGTFADLATGAVQSIGRYFGVVSAIPSTLLVVFFYVLLKSGAWVSAPNWSRAFESLVHPGIGGLGLLSLASLGVALALHPMQFAIVQLYEGYWGNWGFTQRLRIQRILRYQKLQERLEQQQTDTADLLENLMEVGAFTTYATPRAMAVRASLISIFDEAARVSDSLPRAQADIMPTRLGNVMRRFERQAGSQYEIDAPLVFPHLMLVAPADHVAYVNDQRSQFDLAIRMSFTSVLACALSVGFLWRHGAWLLVSLIPYVLAYLCYRGAVVLARQYATAVNTVVDLNRFALYDRLRVKPVDTTAEERQSNKDLMMLLRHSRRSDIAYTAPSAVKAAPDVSQPASLSSA